MNRYLTIVYLHFKSNNCFYNKHLTCSLQLNLLSPVLTEIQFFKTDDIHEAVLPQLLDGVPAEVQLLQRLDHAHGAPGDRRVRDTVAA